jgi:hypothetical protein
MQRSVDSWIQLWVFSLFWNFEAENILRERVEEFQGGKRPEEENGGRRARKILTLASWAVSCSRGVPPVDEGGR